MNEDRRYFEDEHRYLTEAGAEFARLHPARAKFLNLSDPRSRDPHIERLIEAFAFLTGSIRRRIDDDFPEITHALLDLVWPHHLRPIPPIALLKFTPVPGMVREPQVIERGFLVESKPTSKEIPCRFSTAFPVTILPLEIREAMVVPDEGGQPLLRFRIGLVRGADAKDLEIERLRLFIAGESPVAYRIYHVLRTMVDSIALHFSRERRRILPGSAIKPVGFDDQDSVLPYPPVSFPGYRLLTEYFVFPEKFRFVDIVGIGALELDRGQDEIYFDIRFSQRPPDGFRPTTDSFELYVTPIVNLFPTAGDPIEVTQLKQRYAVSPDFTRAYAYDVISVDQVEARLEDGRVRPRTPFYSFEHDPNRVESEDEHESFSAQEGEGEDRPARPDGISYSVTHRINAAGRWATHLALVSNVRGQLPAPETLSLQLTCSNGRLCDEVRLEDICLAAEERPDFVTFHNITRPTRPIYPKLGNGNEWRFISHMALTFISVSEARALMAILSLYNPGDSPANQHRIDSIREVRTRPLDRLIRGAPIRGTQVRITIDETHFDDEGDLLLFNEVLNEFLSLHTTINSFTELVVLLEPSGKEYTCPPAYGKKSLI
jgi:type VI secretion system protein ImpG